MPRNSGEASGFAELDLRWFHDFPFGKDKKESPRLTLAVDAFNVTNRVNYVTYVGVELTILRTTGCREASTSQGGLGEKSGKG